jgi:hypothetical protein
LLHRLVEQEFNAAVCPLRPPAPVITVVPGWRDRITLEVGDDRIGGLRSGPDSVSNLGFRLSTTRTHNFTLKPHAVRLPTDHQRIGNRPAKQIATRDFTRRRCIRRWNASAQCCERCSNSTVDRVPGHWTRVSSERAEKPNAQSSVAFSFAPEHVRRTDRRTSPQRTPPPEKLNVDCSATLGRATI